MTEKLERQVIELIATDRISIPIKSMAGKLDRGKPKLAYKVVESMELEDDYFGDRVYARLESEDKLKARGMREGIEVFAEQYPRYGTILNGIIEQKRAEREKHLYFGMNEGCKITSDDYLGVMTDLGFNQTESQQLYPRLMEISRKLSKARDEERSILVG